MSANKILRVGILGVTGRMGQLLQKNITEDDNCELSSVLLRTDDKSNIPSSCVASDDYRDFLKHCDGIIDFSLPEASEQLLSFLLDNDITKPIVIGTTGLNEHQKNLLKQAGTIMPICYSTNMSLGIAILNKIVYTVAKQLKHFDCEIVEQHHRYKKDSPSGTALSLAHSATLGRELDLDKVRVSGRDGNIGQRKPQEIGVMSLRGGDIVGKHTVGFYNDGEFLEFNHTSTSRETFSKGALSVFKWLIQQKEPNLYSINDFLTMNY